MIETKIICDICAMECTDNSYGIALGPMNNPQEHIHLNLCEEHFKKVTDEVFEFIKKLGSNG